MRLLIVGSVLMLLAVALGAFGAHALSDLLIDKGSQGMFDIASRYHFYHAISLLVLGLIQLQPKHVQGLSLSAALICFGTILFSGSLYCMAIFTAPWLGFITPLGGLLLLLGWANLVYRLNGALSK